MALIKANLRDRRVIYSRIVVTAGYLRHYRLDFHVYRALFADFGHLRRVIYSRRPILTRTRPARGRPGVCWAGCSGGAARPRELKGAAFVSVAGSVD
jgi:hypothetical protein